MAEQDLDERQCLLSALRRAFVLAAGMAGERLVYLVGDPEDHHALAGLLGSAVRGTHPAAFPSAGPAPFRRLRLCQSTTSRALTWW